MARRRRIGRTSAGLAAALAAGLAAGPAFPVEAPGAEGEVAAAAYDPDRDSLAAQMLLAIGRMIGIEASSVTLARERIPETIYIARMRDETCAERCKTVFFLERIGPGSVVGVFDLGRDYTLVAAGGTASGEAPARPAFEFASGAGPVSVIYFQDGEMRERRRGADPR